MTDYKKILIVRTDKIGDVVLSTATISATRKAFPNSYIVVMVAPHSEEIVRLNPYLDEVIIYDKDFTHRRIFSTLRFIKNLKGKRFDLALILHSTKRVNLICFLAGIPERIGYARGKFDFCLTKRLEYTKRLGEKHEIEYTLDVLRAVGVNVDKAFEVFVPVEKEAEEKINKVLELNGVFSGDRLIGIHPGASCISKRWPLENFAKLADRLIERFKTKIVVISGPAQVEVGKGMQRSMRYSAISMCGKTNISELAALLKRCNLFISNDSGPVHIACGVGTPVISIFGRNEKGLSPIRWKPVGKDDVFLHRDVGCIECLAHNCNKDFLCLKAISVDEVFEAAEKILVKSDIKN